MAAACCGHASCAGVGCAGAGPATPSSVLTGTFPSLDDQVPSGQAHLLWLAARENAGMQATFRYIGSINGSTATLTSISGDFVNCQRSISLGTTPADIRNELADLRRITGSFRGETDTRLRETGGDPEKLRGAVQAAISGDPAVAQAEDPVLGDPYAPGALGFRPVGAAGRRVHSGNWGKTGMKLPRTGEPYGDYYHAQHTRDCIPGEE